MNTLIRFLGLGALLATVMAGCAGRIDRSSAMPSALPADLAGTWQGVVTGVELSTAQGVQDLPARLTVDPDGHWTLVMRSGSADVKSTGTFRAVGDTILLDGTQPGAGSAEVHSRLERTEPRALFGSVDSLIGGKRVETGIQLRKVG